MGSEHLTMESTEVNVESKDVNLGSDEVNVGSAEVNEGQVQTLVPVVTESDAMVAATLLNTVADSMGSGPEEVKDITVETKLQRSISRKPHV